MKINLDFDFYSDSNGGDPDSKSATLRDYHQYLWSKPLPNGKTFTLEKRKGKYLYHHSELGEFSLGSDAITHSYRNQKSKLWLTKQIPEEVNKFFTTGKTLASYIIFPNNQIDKKFTINQARGVNSFIDDRFDLTLECIRRFYLDQESPLTNTFVRYRNFFDLFKDFEGYVNFFLLNDLITKNGAIKFYLPFDEFNSKPGFKSIHDYKEYTNNASKFVIERKERMKSYLDNFQGV